MTASRDATVAEPLSTQRELELLRDLQRLASERFRDEERIRAALAEGLQKAERDRDAAAAAIEREFTEGRSSATNEYESVTGEARQRYESARNAAQQEYKGLRHGVETELSRVKEAAHSEKEQASWETLTVFDALKGQPRERFLATVKRLDRQNQELAVLERDAVEIMQMRRQWREFPAVAASSDAESKSFTNGRERVGPSSGPVGNGVEDDPARLGSGDRVEAAIERAADLTSAVREAAIALHRQKLPRLFEGGTPVGVFFALWAIAAVPCGLALGWASWPWIVASAAIAVVATAGLLAWLRPIARRQSGRQFQKIQRLLADARRGLRAALEAARERGEGEAQALVAKRDEQLMAVEKRVHALVGERESWSEEEIGRAGQTFPQRLAELRTGLDRTLAGAKRKHCGVTLAGDRPPRPR